jgi:hypothetical protein
MAQYVVLHLKNFRKIIQRTEKKIKGAVWDLPVINSPANPAHIHTN